MIDNGYDRNTQDGMFHWHDARRLRRDHRLAAVVRLIRRIAWHRAAALHRLFVSRYRGEAVRKLQRKKGGKRQGEECNPSGHLYSDSRAIRRASQGDGCGGCRGRNHLVREAQSLAVPSQWFNRKICGEKLFITHQDRRRFLREARETPPPMFGLITNSSTVTPESST